MQLTSALFSLALAGSVLAAPTIENEKRANTCGKIGVVGNGIQPAYSFNGEFSYPSQCTSKVQYAGYSSASYDHISNTCNFYDQAVSALGVVGSSGATSMFWDKDCGIYSPTCAVQVSADANNNVKYGGQYQLATLTADMNSCYAQCDARSDCYAIAVSHTPNQCFLYSQTTAFLSAGSPPLSSGPNVIQMYDLFCGAY